MQFYKNWNIKKPVVNEAILEYCENNRLLASLLINRGINTPEKIKNFLNPFSAKLSSPDVFTDMEKASIRVFNAIENNEHITVYGDFDADGVTSSALLYLTLKELGADVDYYLPDRETESHGLNTKALVKIISKRKSKLIITVDCGISNVDEVKFAKGFKTDIIITDHHEAPEILPDAYAILNPKALNSINSNIDIDELQSLNYLAGVGVAFKFACNLLTFKNKENFIQKIIPLAAIGTIGDVVELIGENRSIVATGIELIKKGEHKGITKLILSAGIKSIKDVTSETIAFYVVPKINAAGRLESSETAIKFLISDNDEEINNAVVHLENLNSQRQLICDEIFCQAEKLYLSDTLHNKKSIILFSPNWHVGVIGIVASKLVEKYNKPVFLMTSDSNNPNIIKCSCRSIDGINIHSVLSNHKELFEGFGGHKMAAGFSFDSSKISFEKFKSILIQAIDEVSQNVDFNTVSVDVDLELNPSDINIHNVNIIEKMQPFGSANPLPLFVLNNAVLDNFRMMGQENNHLKMFLSKENSQKLECVKWNFPDFSIPLNSNLDVLFSMKLNTFNDVTNVQLMVEDIHSEYLKQSKFNTSVKILDHRNKSNIINQVLDFVLSTKKNTAIYMENSSVLKNYNIPNEISTKIFSQFDIPSGIEQLMFFDSPNSADEFNSIIKKTGAGLVHLMNFNVSDINPDEFIIKISGMLKYAITNMSGVFTVQRIAKALTVSEEVAECALEIFDELELIDLNKDDLGNCKISFMHPLELSKIKNSSLFPELEALITQINEFRQFYLHSSVDELKEVCL